MFHGVGHSPNLDRPTELAALTSRSGQLRDTLRRSDPHLLTNTRAI